MIKSVFYLLAGLVLLASHSVLALATVLEGKVSLEGSSKNNGLAIHVNGTLYKTKTLGFSLKIPVARVYQVKVEAEGYYPSVQTFSHYELSSLQKQPIDQVFSLPEISLVKRKAKRVMLAFGGDVMMGRRYAKPYFNEPVLINKDNKLANTKALVQHVKPFMEIADFSAVNLETQISDVKPKQRAPKGVTFYSPSESLEALKWAGIDYVTLGNNHIYDYLDEGLLSTLKYLKESNLAYSGAGINQQEALKAYRTKLAGQKYSMLGFVGWQGSFTPNQTADEHKGGSALGTKENIIHTVSRETQKGNATVVQYHGSLEYTDEPTGMTESRLKTAIDHGADLAVAHHPHVTQGFEIYKGKLIAYSMGNFVFDQYFHASPHSYILYVWMDGEAFHRAEIVPVYLKGYVPIPATGIQRNTVSKRAKNLTQRRGLNFSRSGGHLVLTKSSAKDATTKTTEETIKLAFTPTEKIKDIYNFPINDTLLKVDGGTENTRYRLGENQLNGGDFESFNLFSSDERGWLLENSQLSKQQKSSGEYSVAANLSQAKATIGMQTFRRVFDAGNPMSYVAKILNTDKPIKVKLFFQKRKKRDKLFAAMENKKQLLKELIIQPDNSWQTIEVDFNTPRVGYRSYRILLEVSSLDKNHSDSQLVYLDDIALIKWQAHYNQVGTLPRDKSLLNLATHIGVEEVKGAKEKLALKFK